MGMWRGVCASCGKYCSFLMSLYRGHTYLYCPVCIRRLGRVSEESRGKMESRVLDNGVLEVKKSFHGASYIEETAGWMEGKAYFTLEELEKLWLLLPHLMEEMKAVRTQQRQKKREDLERQLKELQ